jgi:hypothetical protein
VSIDANGLLDVVSAGQLIVFKNLYTQFQSSSLRMILTLHLEKGSAVQSVQDVIRDLDMGDVKLAVTSDRDSITRTKTRLLEPGGSTAMEWQDFVGPAEIGLAVRSKLGEPIYSQLERGAVALPQ